MQPIQPIRMQAPPAMPPSPAPFRAHDFGKSSLSTLSHSSLANTCHNIWKSFKTWILQIFGCGQTARAFVPGQPVGLANAGNNCWLNSMIQIAAHNPNFERIMQGVNGFPQMLVNYRNAQNTAQTVVPGSADQVLQLRQSFHRAVPNIISNEDRQEDFAEALEAPLRNAPNDQAPFFMVQEGAAFNNQNPDNIIRLAFAGGRERRLEQLFSKTFFNDNGNQQIRRFAETPPELMMHILRFSNQPRPWYAFWENPIIMAKLPDRISVPLRFQVAPRFIDGAQQAQNYQLNWFVIHGGSTMDSGHYTAGVKDNQGRWWHISDNEVTPMSEAQALDKAQKAYFVDYRNIP